ncbi:MAG: ABC transporter permease [Hungatella sp.]|uniref:Sugar ABC transporter permease n=1 Tax=Hungatella hominis TaxID=2763050 RepID=A0ABR7H9K9_9FIRM|nr:ABC transporter permease subunit [Hungatella hominis]MBC5709833.1 sugar ABC transporter permease [Hungatella hominis]
MAGKKKGGAALPPRRKKGSLSQRFVKDIRRNWILYLLLLPGLLSLILFKIGPVGGMVIAFEKFSAFQGILGSKWVGLDNFKRIFADPYIPKVFMNTIILAVLTIVVVFPIPIIFSLFLNEIRQKWVRSTVQSLSFLPYFISAAVMVSILYTILSPSSGIVNNIIRSLGGSSVNFMAKPGWFRPLYVILEIWQTFGYSAIIYIAAMMNIDPSLYEAAEVDGANRWDKMLRITLPCISTSIIVMLIISVGNIFTVNLDRILLMYNSSVYDTADVIQTYVYRIAFESKGFPDYSYGTAVNILKSVIAFVMVSFVNKMADRFAETRLF